MANRRDFIWVGSGRLLTALIGIAAIRAATTFLSPSEYGELAMLISVQALCGLFLINPVGQYINRHTHEWWDEGTLLARMPSYGAYVFVVSILGAVVGFLFLTYPSMEQRLFAAFTLFFIVNFATWNATYLPMLNMLGFREGAVGWTVVTLIVGLATSITLVICWKGSNFWFAGQIMGLLLGAWGGHRLLCHNAVPKASIANKMPLLDRSVVITYCLPLAIATGFMWLQQSGYRFVVRQYWGLDALGYLTVGLLLAGQIWALAETLIQQYLFPLFYRRITDPCLNERQLALSDLINFTGPLYLVLAGATFLGAPCIVKLLASQQYEGADIYVRFGVGIELCRVIGNLIGQAAHITKRTGALRLPYASGAIFGILGIGIAGECQFDMRAVGVVLLLAAFVTLLLMAKEMYVQVPYAVSRRRWLAGLSIMATFCISAQWLGRPDHWPEVIAATIGIGILTVLAVSFLSWNEATLTRFLAIELRGKMDDRK